MGYTPATSLPSLNYFQWGTATSPNPTLSAPLSPLDTTVYFSQPPLDHTGAIITGGFLMGIKNADSYVMTAWIAAGAVSVDGLSATIVQGIRLEGLDYTTSDSSLIPAEGFSAGDSIFCNISGVIQALTIGAIRGVIATNGLGFILGDGTASNATISHKDNASTKGFLRKNPASAKVQYSNDGSSWVNIDDVTASNLLVISSADTTPSYLENKIVAGNQITITKNNTGANETLTIATVLPDMVVSPSTYTPAYLTGGTAAEATYTNWLAVAGASKGSFQITIDGTPLSITNIDFTGVTSMADVASKIETAIRLVTSRSETVVWSTNRFIIASGLTTASSAITVTTAGVSGTDISGAGAANWMDCDAGNGVVTYSILGHIADAAKLVKTKNDGLIDANLMDWDNSLNTRVVLPFTLGEAIDGSSTPQAVYLKASDGKVWRCDADAVESTYKFIGFVTTNALISSLTNVIVGGIVKGFTNLTANSDYYVSGTTGAISTTPGVSEYKVARAISTTSILIERGVKVVSGTDSVSTTSVANNDTVITCGFRPKQIVIEYFIQGHGVASGSPYYNSETGVVTYNGITQIGRFAIGREAASQSNDNVVCGTMAGLVYADSNAPSSGVGAGGSTGGISMTLSVPAISDTGFTIRKASATNSGSPSTARAILVYKAIG